MLNQEDELKSPALTQHTVLISDVDLNKKVHPWRRCEMSMHFVREHNIQVKPSEDHPDGTVLVRAHCARNHSGKDELSHDEIQYITETYFPSLSGAPTSNALPFENSDKYDNEIRGWTRYWNDIFNDKPSLDPNMVKALIATESGFRLDPPENRKAHGLMQILGSTHRYLQDPRGELANHLVCVSATELLEPSSNICAGVRWLFTKQGLTAYKLNRSPSWVEVIADYKGLLKEWLQGTDPKPIRDLQGYYNDLSKKHA